MRLHLHIPALPLLFMALLFLPSAACTACPAMAAERAGEKPIVAVSILPQKYFVDRLSGGAVDCLVFVDRGGDPHTYEPTVSIMARAARARLYFTIGVPFEPQWTGRFKDLNPELEIIVAPITLQAQPYAGHDAGHGAGPDAGSAHGRTHGHDTTMHADDPHIWLSPAAMRDMVPVMRDALARLLPERREEIMTSAEALLHEISTLEQDVTALFAELPPDQRSFLTFHHAWGYYAQNFGLTEHSVEYMGKEPGPRGMAELVLRARNNSIRVIVVSPGTNRSSAEAVAANIKGTVVEADPLAEDWPDNIRRISQALAQGLGAAPH